ncbi:MAG: pirin family protein [Candidatus Acidiferrales bacterium]
MVTVRLGRERGHTVLDWLDSYHTFSFDQYYDPEWVGFRSLRVLNEDRVAPGRGFGTHPHRDMEILTYVLAGALEHKDSLGTGSVIRPGELQRMSAGTGIAHSEFNGSKSEPVHLLQIWIRPEKKGLAPGYQQKAFSREAMKGKLLQIAGPAERGDIITVHQDVSLYTTELAPGQTVRHALAPGQHAWVQVARGAVTVNGKALSAGDAAALSDEPRVELAASAPSELLLFDLA